MFDSGNFDSLTTCTDSTCTAQLSSTLTPGFTAAAPFELANSATIEGVNIVGSASGANFTITLYDVAANGGPGDVLVTTSATVILPDPATCDASCRESLARNHQLTYGLDFSTPQAMPAGDYYLSIQESTGVFWSWARTPGSVWRKRGTSPWVRSIVEPDPAVFALQVRGLDDNAVIGAGSTLSLIHI